MRSCVSMYAIFIRISCYCYHYHSDFGFFFVFYQDFWKLKAYKHETLQRNKINHICAQHSIYETTGCSFSKYIEPQVKVHNRYTIMIRLLCFFYYKVTIQCLFTTFFSLFHFILSRNMPQLCINIVLSIQFHLCGAFAYILRKRNREKKLHLRRLIKQQKRYIDVVAMYYNN